MLRSLLLCFSAAAVTYPGSVASGAEIDFMVPEPQPPVHVLQLRSEPPAGKQWTELQQREFLRCVAERVRLLLPGEPAPRLVRKEHEVFLHLYGKSRPRQADAVATLLQHSLNRRVQTYFLPVHPHQQELLQRPVIRTLIARYESDITAWMEGDRSSPPPRLPQLPDSGDTAGYMLAEQPGVMEGGIIAYGYLIVRAPEIIRSEGLLVSNEDVEEAEIAAGSVMQQQQGVRICLNPTAAPRLHKLTLPLARRGGQIALVSDGAVLAVATVPAPLSREFILTAVDAHDMVFALLPPLPANVKLAPTNTQGSR
ncbi:MAG: hypothetical protein IJB00_06910 [Akkermansia sp.]|nr:hypothetical protein [Akkermansia sp.]